ncbi:MAG: IS1 family transposase [Dehalococcoidia bacterium]
MNRLSPERRAQVIRALVEGNSIRSTCRMTGAAKGTVLKLLADIGEVCRAYQDAHMKNLYARRVQCDEIWSFCHAKAKNVPEEHTGEFGYGDVWTWTAIDADSKLVLSWAIGGRDSYTALAFMQDVARRLAQRVQLTTDGHKVYLDAVERAFGSNIDYAMLVKVYGGGEEPEKRYSPATCVGANPQPIQGNPDPKHVSTSYVERQNLTMRMSMRRFTRLTNAFSKKVQNLGHAVALHFMSYNFCRRHQTLGMSPAMAAGIEDHEWTVDELVALLEASENQDGSN